MAADDVKGARELDRARTDGIIGPLNPRAAERAATCLFLCSVIGARAGGRQGATEAELKAALFVPDPNYSIGEADTVLAELMDVRVVGCPASSIWPARAARRRGCSCPPGARSTCW